MKEDKNIRLPSQRLINYNTHKHSHLYGADDSPKQANHAEELHSAQVFYGVFLTHVRHCIQRCTDQDQTVTQQDV